MKRLFFALMLVMLLASIAITGPAQAAGGPHGRPHRSPTHRVTCVSQAAQSSASAWMNGLRGIGGVAYTTRWRKKTLAYARTEPGWFRAKVKRAARLQDRGRTQKAIGVIWSAIETPCR